MDTHREGFKTPLLFIHQKEGFILLAIYKNEKYNKPFMSKILLEFQKKDWKSTSDFLPEKNKEVIVRIVNDDYKISEDDLHIFPAEDMKLAILNNDDEWEILPPHPLFDYSVLSNKEKLNEGASVSHWCYPEEVELKDWKTRLNLTILKDSKINISVKEEYLELIYKALMHGAVALANETDVKNPKSKFSHMYMALFDMMNSLHHEKTEAPILDTKKFKDILSTKRNDETMSEKPIFAPDELFSSFNIFKDAIVLNDLTYDSETDKTLDLFSDNSLKLTSLCKICNQLNDLQLKKYDSAYIFMLLKEDTFDTVGNVQEEIVARNGDNIPFMIFRNGKPAVELPNNYCRGDFSVTLKHIEPPYRIKLYMFKNPKKHLSPTADWEKYLVTQYDMIKAIEFMIKEGE